MQLTHFLRELQVSYNQNIADINILACHFLNIDRAKIYTFDQPLEEPVKKNLKHAVQRLAAGEPLAYIIETKDFWSLSLKVNSSVLIPRPETELIVEKALQLLPKKFSGEILDLGTGSGALALSLASEFQNAHIDACDISADALSVAKENSIRNGMQNVTFYQSNWFEALKDKSYDLIVSNPPYIEIDDPHLKHLQWEPQSALTAESNGLSDLIMIIEGAQPFLKPHGWLIVEHGYNQESPVREIFIRSGFRSVDTDKDLGGMPRISFGQVAID